MNRAVRIAATVIVALEGTKAMEMDAPSCTAGIQPCEAGCYFQNQDQDCRPTPMGHYSPQDDDSLYTCLAGSYAAPGASQCTPCPPGSASWADGFGACLLCSPGFYSNEGASTCTQCNAEFYMGPGSPGVYHDDDGSIFCLDPRSLPTTSPTVSLAPSIITSAPSQSPSFLASALPTHSWAPSLAPSNAPSVPLSSMPTSFPTIMATTQAPTTLALTTIPTPTFRSPSPQRQDDSEDDDDEADERDDDDDNDRQPPTGEIRNKKFAEAAKEYLPLLAVAFVLFGIGYLYRMLKPRKTRRPPRTVPPPPPKASSHQRDHPDDASVETVDLEAQPTQTDAPKTSTSTSNPALVPKRANRK